MNSETPDISARDSTGPVHGVVSARAERLGAAIADWPRQKVMLTELWRILDDVDPTSRMTHDRRHVLLCALGELAGVRRIELPATASWERSQKPHLPRFVRRPAAPAGTKIGQRIVWHSALAWAAETRIAGAQRADLAKINRWLHADRSELIVPLRERSIEIFGHEKKLDRMLRTSLFAPDRLTLELLRTRRAAPRFTYESVGDGSTLLVVENSDTFDSLSRALAAAPGPVGIVAWGSGGGFEASVLSVRRLPAEIDRILYFGDLDLRGLQIPSGASRTATSEGLPPVEPAVSLYEALLRRGQLQANARVRPETARDAVTWLPEFLREPVAGLLVGGRRLAQEDIGISYLTETPAWRTGLQ